MRLQAPRGTQDIIPGESERWVWLENTFREICRIYNYREIRTPMFEDTELFVRGIGEGTDIVHKEMYTFTDKGGRSITLKPEGTAPAIRAYIEKSLGATGQITKLSYVTPIFRYERPQMGRYRQSHQTGVELIGSDSPDADVEVIELTVRFYEALGMKSVSVRLNSLGMEECRAQYRAALLEYAAPVLSGLDEDYRKRCEQNPLRLLDSKDAAIQEALLEAPSIETFLEDSSREHFDAVRLRLELLGIQYTQSPRLVRGLDYYTKTVFEVQSESLGAQNALCGGGRYDNLVREIGGPDTPAVGVAMGIERALMVLSEAGRAGGELQVFAVCLTENVDSFAKIVASLRSTGISVDTDPDRRSAKSQFRQADKSGAQFAVVIGDDEIADGSVNVKNLQSGKESKVTLAKLAEQLAKDSLRPSR